MLETSLPALEPMEPRLLLSMSAGFAAVAPAAGPWTETPTAYIDDFQPAPRDHHPVIRERVLDTVAAIEELLGVDPGADASVLSVGNFPRVTPAGEIYITIDFESARTEMLTALTALGFDAESFRQTWYEPRGKAWGWASYTAVGSLAEVPGVLSISLPLPAVTRTGSITSAGDGILNADDLRALLDVDGTGLKVGVISDGANHWDEVEDFGDLPESITIDQTRPGDGDEGTAMLEIIYDLAPGAELYFSGPGNASDEMVASIQWLVNQGCDVIVDDLGYYAEPMFEDGQVADAAADAIGDGVVYVSAAGNDAETHYQGDFDDFGDGSHRFAQGQNLLRFDLPAGESVMGVLQWSDEWGASGNNYNLYLLGWTGSAWTLVDESIDVQNGDDDPLEGVIWDNTGAGTVSLAWLVHQFAGADRELELFTLGNVDMVDTQIVVAGDSIFGHPAAEGVIAVGAIDAADSGNDDIEDSSSRGPSTVYTNFSTQTSTQRDSLDVAGIDGVHTVAGGEEEWFGHDPFFGTSAAAPHVAAIAALLLEIDPALTVAEVRGLITDNAVDLGDTGYDEVFGFGRADALATVSAATDAPNLAAGSDTGVSDTDDLTKLDNSDTGKKLQFTVSGATDGALVTVYAGSEALGSATASGTSATVLTDGDFDLTDGEQTITARQTEDGKLESVASTGLTVTIDTAAPTVAAFYRGYQGEDDWKLRPTQLWTISLEFSEDVVVEEEDALLDLDNLSQDGSIDPVQPTYDSQTFTATWDYGGITPDVGWYLVTLSAGVEDLAGNALDGDGNGIAGGDYVYGAAAPENDMLIPILGDADLDGEVGWTDSQIVSEQPCRAPAPGRRIVCDFDRGRDRCRRESTVVRSWKVR